MSSNKGSFDHYSIVAGIKQIAEQQHPFRVKKFIEIDEYMLTDTKIIVENLRTTTTSKHQPDLPF